MTEHVRGQPHLVTMLDDANHFGSSGQTVPIGARAGMSQNTAIATVFAHNYGPKGRHLAEDVTPPRRALLSLGRQLGKRDMTRAMLYHHFYGPPAKVILDEMSDNPTVLNSGTPRYSELPVHRLLGAYLQAYQVWCDRFDAFRNPPFPRKDFTRFQVRWYYRQKGWHGPVDWAQQNMEFAFGRYLKALKRLSPRENALWQRYLAGWRNRHGRNLPHEPVKPATHMTGFAWCDPTLPARKWTPKPVPKNARERRAVRISNKRASRSETR